MDKNSCKQVLQFIIEDMKCNTNCPIVNSCNLIEQLTGNGLCITLEKYDNIKI